LAVLLGPVSAQEAPKNGVMLSPAVVSLFEEINAFRAENGLDPVKFSSRLVRAAASHSDEQASLDYFSHHSPNPTRVDAWTRAELYGYDWGELCENIFRTDQTEDHLIVQETMEGWKSSGAHRANLLAPKVKDIGLGIARYSNGDMVVTLMMGREL
jgi:uncharacterized protein YkwD